MKKKTEPPKPKPAAKRAADSTSSSYDWRKHIGRPKKGSWAH